MKAIILCALVACVAARGVDLQTLRLLKEKSLLTRPVLDDILLKEKLTHRVPLEKNVVLGEEYNKYPIDTPYDVQERYPVDFKYNQDRYPVDYKYDVDTFYNKGIYDVDRVYTIEELYQTELFREYLNIPLFRQYIQYPSFQRFVSSAYFQKFWTIPTYRTYFRNPVLFYKYIVPLVQLFHSEYNTLPYTYQYGQQDVYKRDQEYPYGYFKNLIENVIYRNKNYFPYADYFNRYTYGQQYPSQYYAGQYYNAPQHYKVILDKLYKTLFLDQPVVGDVTQVKTDVKIVPGEKKVVVEPITGEKHLVEEPKIVDVKVDQKVIPVEKIVDTIAPVDTTFEHKYVSERELVILKELLKEKVITPEVYEAVVRGHVEFSTILRQYFGRHFVNTDYYNNYFNRRDVDVVDQYVPQYYNYNQYVNRQYTGNDRLYNFINKFYNTEYPTHHRWNVENVEYPTHHRYTENTYNRFPIVA